MVEAFRRSPDIRMVYGMVRCIKEPGGETIMLWGRDREPSDIRRKMYLPTPSVFSRRDLWDEVGPYRDEYEYGDKGAKDNSPAFSRPSGVLHEE